MTDEPLERSGDELDPYLWDGSGPPDAEVAALEATLSVFRHGEEAGERVVVDPAVCVRPPEHAPGRDLGAFRALASAALLVVAVGAAWAVGRSVSIHGNAIGGTGSEGVQDASAGWDVAVLTGAPSVDGGLLADGGVLAVGGRLVTDGTSTARVTIADIGRADIAPNSSVRLVGTGNDEHRLALDHGKISAYVVAPPRLFLVETPAALAVDLGCAYDLEVDEEGRGELRVTSGWVSLESADGISLVPAGATCRIAPGQGAGIPRYESSPSTYDELLDRVERGDVSPGTIERVIAGAPRGDTLTLFHVLFRVTAEQRPALVDAIAAREDLPEGLDVAAVIRLDREAMDAWREDLRWSW